jgi:hypothetical protein
MFVRCSKHDAGGRSGRILYALFCIPKLRGSSACGG